MNGEVTIIPRALKHGLSEEDILSAWRNSAAIRMRNFDIQSIYAVAGSDTRATSSSCCSPSRRTAASSPITP